MASNSVQSRLGNIEGKMDLLITQVGGLKTAFDTLEAGRLSAVEKEVANITGRIGIISAGIATIIPIAIELIKGYLLR